VNNCPASGYLVPGLLRRERGTVRRLPVALNPHSVALLLALVLRVRCTDGLASNSTTNEQCDSNKNADEPTPARTIRPLTPSNHKRQLTGANRQGLTRKHP
jgi:hypothetical protein